MKLSIIVVNYNVKYFLQQLLQSIASSRVSFEYEVIVIDNNSSDGSEMMVRNQYPDVRYVFNQVNLGFAKANNQGIRIARGRFVLLLNPDTMLQEDTLEKTVSFASADDSIGAVGVRMIDGSGRFLPESKRGLPTPGVAFYKAFGLSAVFPRSATFNRYYLGHLSEDQTHEIDILTGAFFLVPKKVLDEVGLLDEQFFMYGEDIDLSYRIQQAGYKIMYYPATSIIHFKGESTKKDSIAYIRSFYGAMIVFADKHFSDSRAKSLQLVLKTAIYIKAGWSLLIGLVNKWALPIVESAAIFFVLGYFATFWARFYYGDPSYYEQSHIQTNFIIYIAAWFSCLLFAGAYDEIYRWKAIFRGWLSGWILIAILYAFFDPALRPSRAILLISGPLVLLAIFVIRSLGHRLSNGTWFFLQTPPQRFAIVAEQEEVEYIRNLMNTSASGRIYVGQVTPSEKTSAGTLGHLRDLDQLAHFHQLSEIVFASKDVDSSEIMKWMTELGPRFLYKIAPDRASTIVGSHSKNKPGEWFTFEIKYRISHPSARRIKRLLDSVTALIFILISPLLAMVYGGGLTKVLSYGLAVLSGQKTWVSYQRDNSDGTLPNLRPGLIVPAGNRAKSIDSEEMQRINFFYARDYSIWKDVSLLWQNFKFLFN